ncbi:hypothetical protein [Acrocarpospora sp. B8E8]|uniref:hypothetical protein n=1 Tax=Acrocarpospora sp. B8E8 TaxID=3153572 RepID=UPI00325CE64C
MSETAPEVVDEQEPAEIDEPVEPERIEPPAAGPDGFPPNTPVADMAPGQQAAYWRFQAKKHEKTAKAYGDYKPDQVKAMASRIAEIEDAQKTDQQRMIERAEAAEKRAHDAEVARARLLAAATHDLPASLLDRLGGGTEDEINEYAEALAGEIETIVSARVDAEVARRMAEIPPVEPRHAANTRPVESLSPGALPDAGDADDPNVVFRRLLGRRT